MCRLIRIVLGVVLAACSAKEARSAPVTSGSAGSAYVAGATGTSSSAGSAGSTAGVWSAGRPGASPEQASGRGGMNSAMSGQPAAEMPSPGTSSAGGSSRGSGGVAGGDAGRTAGAGEGGAIAAGAPAPNAGAGGMTTKPSAGSAGSDSPRAKFHVFLLLGQSNMAGYPKANDADKSKNPRIRVLGYDDCAATGRRKDVWDVAVPPLHECWNGAIGPGDYFAKALIDALPAGDTIGLVPCAISGEKIETFLKASHAKYDWIVQRAKLAQGEGGVIEGILFHQGESNCGDSSWPAQVKTLVQDLKADLGLGSLPFLAGELAPDGACARHNSLVGQLPNVIDRAYVVSASGLKLDPSDTQWHLHFDHDSQVEFGKRYEAKMVEALGW